MELLQYAIDIFLHLDSHLNSWAGMLGPWLYLVLFLIIFCETGSGGDAVPAGRLAALRGRRLWRRLTARRSACPSSSVLLFGAAVAGDAVNYAIGARIGPRVFSHSDSRLFNREHLIRTQRFYEKYGGKTIVLARFIPIIRTFAPFVAGIGTMAYPRFALFNVTGGALWILSFLLGGFFFGNVPVVKQNFHYVIVAIIVISIMPPILEYLRARREGGAAPAEKG